jgi:hypothetical protein
MDTVSENNRLIVIHIGTKEGFLPGGQLVFKAKPMEITIDKLIMKIRWIPSQVIRNA